MGESEARKLLKEDIVASIVTDQSNPADVYRMRPEYSEFEFANFKTNMDYFY